jgi:hypothetical protein
MTTQIQAKTFSVSLSLEAHAIAQDCCLGISNRRQAKQIYLNTLAVYAVEIYLRCMGFETDWKSSDSRNPLLFKFMDVADLEVKELGKLECRPLLPEDDVLKIPPEDWEDRIGYVAVQLDDALREATVIGFTKTATAQVPLNQLQSLDDFLVYLHQVQQSNAVETSLNPIRLNQWVQGIFEGGWQVIDEVLGINNLAWGFARSGRWNSDKSLDNPSISDSVEAAKVFDFGLLLNRQSVALVIKYHPAENQEVDVRVRVCPMGDLEYLPPDLKLKVTLNPNTPSEDSQEVTARAKDNWIQLEFSESPGSKFRVEVSLEDAVIVEELFI